MARMYRECRAPGYKLCRGTLQTNTAVVSRFYKINIQKHGQKILNISVSHEKN